MPSRLRYNNQGGALGAALTNTGTTITFASAPGFATVQSGDHIPILLEPPSGATPSANFEVVWLTAYTAGQTTGTIVRGCEGTTAVAHASGAAWAHAPTAWDSIFGKGADAPWSGNLGYDYEFLNPGTSLPSGWTWTNQGAAVYNEFLKGGTLSAPSHGGSDSLSLISQAVPPAPFTLSAKLKLASGNPSGNAYGGIGLYDGTKLLAWMLGWRSNILNLSASIFSSLTAFQGDTKDVALAAREGCEMYLQMVYHSATSVDFNLSYDGEVWLPFTTGYNASGGGMGAITRIGLWIDPRDQPIGLTCEWFRVR